MFYVVKELCCWAMHIGQCATFHSHLSTLHHYQTRHNGQLPIIFIHTHNLLNHPKREIFFWLWTVNIGTWQSAKIYGFNPFLLSKMLLFPSLLKLWITILLLNPILRHCWLYIILKVSEFWNINWLPTKPVDFSDLS